MTTRRLQRTSPLTGPATGLAALALPGLVIAVALAALMARALTENSTGGSLWTGYLWQVARFTLWQAALSTLLSLALALPVARALARRTRFIGRAPVMMIMVLPLALPGLVAVLGIVTVWGRNGWLAAALNALGTGLDFGSIYGLSGILLGHVFFNMALAVRLMVMHLEQIPAGNWRLAGQLAMGPLSVFRFIEWPALRQVLPGIAGLIFMLCVTSFTVVLTLGGGPGATTMEVAIYQALRFDFEPGRAVMLALMQMALTGVVLMAGSRFALPVLADRPAGRPLPRYDGTGAGHRAGDFIVIALAAAFIGAPVAGLIAAGLGASFARLAAEPVVWQAMATSTGVGLASGTLCVAIALGLISAARQMQKHPPQRWPARALARIVDWAPGAVLLMPPVVLGAGWFIVLHTLEAQTAMAAGLVVIINAMMALAFAVAIVRPAHARLAADYDRLCASLSLTGMARWRLVQWPVLRRPLASAFAFAMALSLGDLGAIALFGSQDLITLPLLILQRMGSYRTLDAAGLALVLGALCLALVLVFERYRSRS